MKSLIRWLAPGDAPIHLSMRAGWRAESVGQAFLPAYRAALWQLVPDLPENAAVCFCVTEEEGNHPRAIQSTLVDGRLNGAKKWSTGGSEGDLLLVAVRVGEKEDGRPDLRIARVNPAAPGVSITEMPPTPFLPDVPHCAIRFDDVSVPDDHLLRGDGYSRYIKPFRTVEDIHVFAALAAWWLRLGAEFGWPEPLCADLVHLLVNLRQLAAEDPNASQTHVALEGAIAAQQRLLVAMEPAWELVNPDMRAGWERDRKLLSIASGARVKRFERAMISLR